MNLLSSSKINVNFILPMGRFDPARVPIKIIFGTNVNIMTLLPLVNP